jgi:phosphate acetyltransferase
MDSVIKSIHDRAMARNGRVILSEGDDARIVVAARRLVNATTCDVTLIGSEDATARAAVEAGVSLTGIDVVDPATHPRREEFAGILCEHRNKKGMTLERAYQLMGDQLLCATMMVREGEGTATVGGAAHATADVLRAALWCIGMAKGMSVVSGAFLMIVPDFLDTGKEKALFFADSGVVPDANAEQLASIAMASADTFKSLTGEEPMVGMLSFSTKGSAKHPDVDKVIEATGIARKMRPDLAIDGELQADAALVSSVGASKAPGSDVAGNANVLIFPDLGAGNIGYKLVQRLAKATAIGPILQGLSKPAHDLSRGCSAEDVADMAAVAICMS